MLDDARDINEIGYEYGYEAGTDDFGELFIEDLMCAVARGAAARMVADTGFKSERLEDYYFNKILTKNGWT